MNLYVIIASSSSGVKRENARQRRYIEAVGTTAVHRSRLRIGKSAIAVAGDVDEHGHRSTTA